MLTALVHMSQHRDEGTMFGLEVINDWFLLLVSPLVALVVEPLSLPENSVNKLLS
jgi:hypothetical protein